MTRLRCLLSMHRTTTYDTLGDGQLGAEFISEEINAVNGPHPGLFRDFFCDIATDLIG
jgi:hypothetical protein